MRSDEVPYVEGSIDEGAHVELDIEEWCRVVPDLALENKDPCLVLDNYFA